MEKIFHVKKNRFSSTDETLRFIFNRFYGILNAEIIRNENGKHFSNNDLYETVKYILAKKIYIQLYYTVNVVGETEAMQNQTGTQRGQRTHIRPHCTCRGLATQQPL